MINIVAESGGSKEMLKVMKKCWRNEPSPIWGGFLWKGIFCRLKALLAEIAKVKKKEDVFEYLQRYFIFLLLLRIKSPVLGLS